MSDDWPVRTEHRATTRADIAKALRTIADAIHDVAERGRMVASDRVGEIKSVSADLHAVAAKLERT